MHLLLTDVGWMLHWDYLLFFVKKYCEVKLMNPVAKRAVCTVAPVIWYELKKNKLWKLNTYYIYEEYWHKPRGVW